MTDQPDHSVNKPFQSPPKAPAEMKLVEIAAEIEALSLEIDAFRGREAEAKAVYQAVADEVEAACASRTARIRALHAEQQRQVHGIAGVDPRASQIEAKPKGKLPMPAAILSIWDLDDFARPLNTDEIHEGLEAVGYRSNAAPRSLKSSINQTIAKLCNAGRLLKYRSDGTPLVEIEGARARRYLRADLAEATSTPASSQR